MRTRVRNLLLSAVASLTMSCGAAPPPDPCGGCAAGLTCGKVTIPIACGPIWTMDPCYKTGHVCVDPKAMKLVSGPLTAAQLAAAAE